MGPPPTVHGLSLPLTEQQLIEKIDAPLRTHTEGKLRTLCYEPTACQDKISEVVKLHVTFEGDRCRAIRGTQLEQSSHVKLNSRFHMPPQHSLEEAQAVLSYSVDSPHSRSTDRKAGPVKVGYSSDLGLEVWVYPDGRRQYILRDVDLPKTVVNLDFP